MARGGECGSGAAGAVGVMAERETGRYWRTVGSPRDKFVGRSGTGKVAMAAVALENQEGRTKLEARWLGELWLNRETEETGDLNWKSEDITAYLSSEPKGVWTFLRNSTFLTWIRASFARPVLGRSAFGHQLE
jgi:hypothetical protein